MSDAANQWTTFYTNNSEIMYPAEAVIRIFKGSYPNLTMPKPKAGQSILDVGFGDGRHFRLFKSLELEVAGSEITEDIVRAAGDRFPVAATAIDLRVGTCAKLPWGDAHFDYLLAWNSCYYMPNRSAKFEDHVAEMARVLKPGGWLVCSIPKHTCFIFNGSEPLNDEYAIIRDDYFGLRNGEVMRRFRSAGEIQRAFDCRFTNFCHANIDIDMFGLAYNWHVFTAERKT